MRFLHLGRFRERGGEELLVVPSKQQVWRTCHVEAGGTVVESGCRFCSNHCRSSASSQPASADIQTLEIDADAIVVVLVILIVIVIVVIVVVVVVVVTRPHTPPTTDSLPPLQVVVVAWRRIPPLEAPGQRLAPAQDSAHANRGFLLRLVR